MFFKQQHIALLFCRKSLRSITFWQWYLTLEANEKNLHVKWRHCWKLFKGELIGLVKTLETLFYQGLYKMSGNVFRQNQNHVILSQCWEVEDSKHNSDFNSDNVAYFVMHHWGVMNQDQLDCCLPEAGDIVTLPMKSVSLVVAYSSKLFRKMFHAPALPRCFR